MAELRGRGWKDGGVCQAKSTSAPMTCLRLCAPVQRLELWLCKAQGAEREVWLRHGYAFSLGSPCFAKKVVLQQWQWEGANTVVLLSFSVFPGCFLMHLCCDGASDMDVVDPFPVHALWFVLGAAHAGAGSCRARAAARYIGANGALVWALLQPQLLSRVMHRVAGMWEPRPPSLLAGLVEIRSFSERSCG